MKKYYAFFIVVLLVNFPGILTPTSGQWQMHVIDDDVSTAVSIDTADLDGDTRLDLVVTDAYNNRLCWYQNSYPSWIKHTIDASADLVVFAYCGDMDGDDTLDVVANLYGSKQMVWYENKQSTWIKHLIDANTNGADITQVADIDGDDTLDVIAGCSLDGGDIVWYENHHPNWTKHIIESGITGMVAVVRVADIDGDNIQDVVATHTVGNKVVWYKTEDKGLTWNRYTIDDNLTHAFGLNVGDIDGDGTVDVGVTTGGPYYSGREVVWYENHHPAWTKHVVDTDLPGGVQAHITDVDGNDTVDIIATGFTGNDVVWYKNNHPNWIKHVIDDKLDGPRTGLVADMDGDKAPDIILPGISSVVWYKNPNTTVAFGKSLDVNSKYISPHQGDTLQLIAKISNPENHQVTAKVFIQGESSDYADSVQLFDDGKHHDGMASDNIFGGFKSLEEPDEDYFGISLRTTDSDETVSTYYNSERLFTTIGPLLVDHYEITEQQGDQVTFKIYLINNGTVSPATEVRAEISTTDTHVTSFGRSFQIFGTIDPKQVKINSYQGYNFETQNNPDSIKFDVSISGSNIIFWRDSITVHLQPTGKGDVPTGIPAKYELHQSYPNPFSHSTNISYSIASTGFVILKVYDLFGREIQTLVNELQKPDTHTVRFDAGNLSSGIYFYRLQVGNDIMKTRKMLHSK